MRAETHELDLLAADFEKAAAEITDKVARTTGMALNNIKKATQKTWSGISHLPHLPRSITYDMKKLAHSVVGEVGALHERPQGKLAWVLEYGSPSSAPRPGFRPATEAELPTWYSFLDKVAAEALEKP